MTDPRSNNISLIDVTEQLNLSPEPPLTGVAKDVDGSLRASWEVDVNLLDIPRRRVVWELEALLVSAPGEHEFRVKIQRPEDQWEIVARIPLAITIRESGAGDPT